MADSGVLVAVPAWNEAARLPALLASLAAQTLPPARVVVADGGSEDGTAEVAERHGAQAIRCPVRGRGNQVAFALAGAAEPIVLVLHADMVAPPRAVAAVAAHLARRPDCPGGCLGHVYDSWSPWMRLVELHARLRADWWGMSYGDQAQFFRRERLAVEGGYPAQPIMEDVELSRRLRRLGRPAYLDVPVLLSARRFERLGWWGTVRRNRRFRLAYRRGGLAACAELHRQYYG